jgi:hypothetical protein
VEIYMYGEREKTREKSIVYMVLLDREVKMER